MSEITSQEKLDAALNRHRLAEQRARRARRKKDLLKDKLRCIQWEKYHKDTLRELRLNYFNIQDSFNDRPAA